MSENFRVALRALAANKLRSVLTTLGIVIGTGAVIALVALGNGVDVFINNQFQAQGANLAFVFPARINLNGGANRSGFVGGGANRTGVALSLSIDDVEALSDPNRVPDASVIAPIVTGNVRATAGGESLSGRIRATTPNYKDLNNWRTIYGDWFDQNAYDSRGRVILLGVYPYKKLFPDGGDPTGADVRLNNVQFRVAGVLAQRGTGTAGTEDDTIILPLTTARERLFPQKNNRNETTVNIVLAQARDKTRVDAMLSQITEVLRQRHGIQFAGEDDFSVATQRDLLSTVNTVTDTLTLFLAAVAGISLFVGGIGIMNIMLVSIQERTREIGLRKAIGAKPVTIMLQFLAEACVLALLGGSIGIALGSGAAAAIAYFANFPALVTVPVMFVAIGFSLLVGLVFGVYPAWRAAQLHPVEALRYE